MQELLVLEPKHIAEDGSYIVIEQAVVMEKGAAARPSLRIATGDSADSPKRAILCKASSECSHGILLGTWQARYAP